ncbi:hypothetical protein M431DRAFT_145036 [Trichoderma harzianum CBS 226.95]|uniref:Uncharacterized protein n=1 Tax=Trichoderma harzianum CBS 226.95 TaxID=983964 RepID=A0A2T4AAE6_TRIHA|nr:hypothetical protein M431DRAFT_145036 [Trichoderma harzianum CBS 226.95]PTB54059.1 hypothetical protein M431DRAFT_145036 [Trichoderma harzianum CBS 226.95]
MQIRSPKHLTNDIDIIDTTASIAHSENQINGALVSIDLNCPTDFIFGRKNLVAKFSLSFTIQIQDGFHKPIAIQHAEVGYYTVDNDIKKLLNGSNRHDPKIKPDAFKDGKADIEIPQPNNYKSNDSINIRIVVLLNAYPSNLEVFASMASLSTTDGKSRPSRAFNSVTLPDITPSPNEARLQRLLCWTAALGHENMFAAYLDQDPSILYVEDEFGMTPFSCAAFAGQTSVIRRALHQGGSAKAREKTTQGPSPLEAAALKDDTRVFVSFLILLKYFGTLKDEILEFGKIPSLENMPSLEKKDIEDEISIAVRKDQTAIIEKLVQMRLEKETEREEWLARQMVQAAGTGALSLVQVLKSRGAKVHTEVEVVVDGEVNHKTTPLMSAIEANRTKVAEFLITHGAGDEDALRLAVAKHRHSIIRALLQAGVLARVDFKKELLTTATREKDSTTVRLLEFEKGTGKLASSTDLNPNVDKHFEATVVTFHEEKTPEFEELSVTDLMRKPDGFFSLNRKAHNFKWFHLPANNMKWAEVSFICKIYHEDPSLAYKVLEPNRWVKRQHEGARGSPHARFMMPACHDFSEAFKDKERFGNLKKDRHVVLYMPYLHWDEEEAMQNRSNFLAEGVSGRDTFPRRERNEPSENLEKSEKDEMLLRTYLLSESNHDLNFRHVLHIRRTLDEYLYHNLTDTIIRDADQTVHRYQKKLNKKTQPEVEDPLTVIMVDQLWLWILVDQSGKAKAIVTCFPSRDWSDVELKASLFTQKRSILDQGRTTDVLQSTRSYIQQRPDAVKTPYDLAGVIATRCSRALLDHSTDMLNFAEVYENSISDIMNEETLLFNTFNSLMQTRTKILDKFEGMTKLENISEKDDPYQSSADLIVDNIQWLLRQEKVPQDSVGLCHKYREHSLESDVPSIEDINNLEIYGENRRDEYLRKLLERFGRFYALDINREITLLSQIKDIQNELETMQMVFTEQNEVLKAMDRIIRTMEQRDSDTNDNMKPAKLHYRRGPRSRKMQEYDSEEIQDRFRDYDYPSSIDILPVVTRSSIWGLGHQEQSLPLRTVRRHSNQIQEMLKRAKNTNKALSSLVDMKQKQSNVIATRDTPIQGEQLHLMTVMTQEGGNQSKALMVFTIVTIIFQPLSFIAAFFAIPTKEFGSDNLTLSFVSKITFPVSTAISVLIIIIGFPASYAPYWRLDEAIHRLLAKFRRSSKFDSDSNQNDGGLV